MDSHKCGDCQKVYNSYEDFLIHKLLDENYTLALENSLRIPSLRLPIFIKSNEMFKPILEKNKNSNSYHSTSISIEPKEVEKSKEYEEQKSVPRDCLTEKSYSPVVELIVDSMNLEDVGSDDDSSDGSQPESLRIDEGIGTKDVSSRMSEPSSDLETEQKNEAFCKKCKRYYTNKVVLRVHQETVHSSTRPHVCPTCRQGFKTKGSLVRHIRTHTGERPFSCSQCQRAFLDSSTLVRHVRRVHRKHAFKQVNDVKVVITRLEGGTNIVETDHGELKQ